MFCVLVGKLVGKLLRKWFLIGPYIKSYGRGEGDSDSVRSADISEFSKRFGFTFKSSSMFSYDP